MKKVLSQGAKLVIAIEPAPQLLECLRRNLASEIREAVYPSTAASVAINRGLPSVKIPLTTIDQCFLLEEHVQPMVLFAKFASANR